MTADSGNCSVVKNRCKFELHAKILLPSDRLFVNYQQLDQYLTQFLSTWSNLKYRNGNFYRCSYSPSGRIYAESESVSNNRNKSNSLKNTIKCPFKITFNQKRSGIYCKKHSILRPVNITDSCRYKHTCILSSQVLRTVVLSSRTQDNVDVKTLSAAIIMLKINPQLPTL